MSLSVCLPLCVSLICLSSSCQHFFFLASFSFISVESAATKNHKQEFVAIQMATNCQCHRAVSTQASFVCVFVVVADVVVVVVVVVVVLYLLYFSFVVQFPSKRMQTNWRRLSSQRFWIIQMFGTWDWRPRRSKEFLVPHRTMVWHDIGNINTHVRAHEHAQA